MKFNELIRTEKVVPGLGIPAQKEAVDMMDNDPPTTCQDLSEDFETSFNIFDTDGSGQISASKLRQKLTEFDLFPSDRQVSNNASNTYIG